MSLSGEPHFQLDSFRWIGSILQAFADRWRDGGADATMFCSRWSSYVQFVFNASLTLMILTALFWFLWTIWGDVKDLRGVYSTGKLQPFVEFVCNEITRLTEGWFWCACVGSQR